jgi:single-strand DNA-binding protein
MNQVTLIGRIGKVPEIITFPETGNKLAKFSLCVKEYSANKEDKTLYVNVDAWGGLADRVQDYITKGREVCCYGRLAINTYDKEINGVKVEISKPVLKLTGFHLCGARPKSDEETTSEEKPAAKKRKLAAAS